LVEIVDIVKEEINTMKLSTKGRYGVRLMIDLALHYGEGPIFLKDIAKRQEVSEKYLWNLTMPLKIAGLINSARGPQGGYTLAKQPSEITLKDIVHVLEGPLCIVECVSNLSFCKRFQTCIARDVWRDISDKISQTLESITLQDMVEKKK
jgi:Rrf2 family protein